VEHIQFFHGATSKCIRSSALLWTTSVQW